MKNSGQITNTEHKEKHPEWVMGGNPGAIEQQEARGQTEMVQSEQLPTEVRGQEALEAAGVVFGSVCEGDDLFCCAVLPEGWKKRSTEHSMWSELVDEHDKVRASIFYKAAFYDRRAFMRAE